MDPVVLDLPTTAWEQLPSKDPRGGKNGWNRGVLEGLWVNEWVADSAEGWVETIPSLRTLASKLQWLYGLQLLRNVLNLPKNQGMTQQKS